MKKYFFLLVPLVVAMATIVHAAEPVTRITAIVVSPEHQETMSGPELAEKYDGIGIVTNAVTSGIEGVSGFAVDVTKKDAQVTFLQNGDATVLPAEEVTLVVIVAGSTHQEALKQIHYCTVNNANYSFPTPVIFADLETRKAVALAVTQYTYKEIGGHTVTAATNTGTSVVLAFNQ